MAQQTRTRTLGQWDGARDGWQADLALKAKEEAVVVDASAIRSASPTFLLRLRAFVEWHLEREHSVVVRCPSDWSVATYMARAEIARGLPDEVFAGLPQLQTTSRSDVLIPVARLHRPSDVETLGERLVPLFESHLDDVAAFANAIHMATSELCGNAVEHGANPLGCYVTAQRYDRPVRRTVLALGDLGIGIPEHMRRRFANLSGDRRALREAVKHGVTGTDEEHRGNGFHWVMDVAQHSSMRYAALDVRSGRAQLKQIVEDGERRLTTTTKAAPFMIGTWATFEIGPLASV